jgi:beta-1,4-N-acetylglucosaminyltransferase
MLTLHSDLATAFAHSEKLRERHKSWPPVNSGEDPSGRGLAGVMEDEMGFVD